MRNLQNYFNRKQFLVLLTSVGLLTVVSCGEAKKESKADAQASVQQELTILPAADSTVNLSVAPEAVPVAAPEASAAPELNPPHGQPFHRCDIAVGSPLNGTPVAKPSMSIGQNGAPTVQNAAAVNNPPVNAAPVNVAPANNAGAPTIANEGTTAPKLNPPHGQPFHRCEIPVGSPLN